MDPMISLGQKNTLAEYMILSDVDNRLPIRMILESVENGPLIWPTVEEKGVIRTKKYVGLSAAEKIQADCDMKATNIILQGLPADIYSLVNHHKVAKDLWERLINDMNIYKMKTEQFQVNNKFLNNLPPEWSKFVTDVKLVKDLHTSNFDQLHAYLEQHELHEIEVRIMRERNQDPLAFVANQQMTPPHFNTYQSYYNNPHLQQQFSPSQHGSIQPNCGLSCKESFIGLFGRGRYLVVLVVEWIKRVNIGGRVGCYLLEKFQHHHHHRVSKMTCLDDERLKKRFERVPCLRSRCGLSVCLREEDA
ncbi:hypothetical protein Tco_0777076 [Tanacetum coccineum]